MKKVITATLFLYLFSAGIMAQNVSKGFKALDEKDYKSAKSIFESALELNEEDAAANFGMSRYYGIAASGEKDKELALEFLVATEKGYAKLDDKTKGKIGKLGVTGVELKTRRNRIEESFLKTAKKENTVEAYDAFLERFPESASTLAATNYRNKKGFEDASAEGTVAALDAFISKYPEAHETKEATVTRNKMASEIALAAHNVEGYKHFLQNYPDAPQAPQMEQRLNSAAFEAAKAANTAEAYRAYINTYPESIFKSQAKEKLMWLDSE